MLKYLSRGKLKKLKEELEHLKTVKRREISKRIEEAMGLGDLSENSEYIEAKEAKAFNEGRILELGSIIKNAVLINPKSKNKNQVSIGCVVRVRSKNKTQEFMIVGSEEADPAEGKISNESPIGRSFLDRKPKDIVEVETPQGKVKYQILSIK